MKKKLAYALVSVVLVVLLLTQINLQDAITSFSNVNYFYLSLGYFFFFLIYLCRTIRFHVFLKGIGIFDMFKVVSLHNLANTILPARTGEVSFIYLTRTRGVRAGHSLGILAMSRLFDLLIISISIIITAFLIEKTNIFLNTIIASVSVVFTLVLVVYLMVFKYGRKSFYIFSKIARMLRMRGRIFKFFKKHIKELYASVEELRQKLVPTFITSVVLWIIVFISNLMFLFAFNIHINFVQTIFLVSIISLLPLVPIYAFGGFGTFEITMSAILILFGVAKETAIISSFGIHITGLIFVGVLGAVCAVLNRSSVNTESNGAIRTIQEAR